MSLVGVDIGQLESVFRPNRCWPTKLVYDKSKSDRPTSKNIVGRPTGLFPFSFTIFICWKKKRERLSTIFKRSQLFFCITHMSLWRERSTPSPTRGGRWECGREGGWEVRKCESERGGGWEVRIWDCERDREGDWEGGVVIKYSLVFFFNNKYI